MHPGCSQPLDCRTGGRPHDRATQRNVGRGAAHGPGGRDDPGRVAAVAADDDIGPAGAFAQEYTVTGNAFFDNKLYGHGKASQCHRLNSDCTLK